MKKMMMAAGCLALAWTAGAAVEMSELLANHDACGQSEPFEGGEVKYPRANASTGLVKEGSSATWKAKAFDGCVFAGWVWTNGTPAAAFELLSENELKNKALRLKIAAGELVRPTSVAATWARIDEDLLGEVTLTPSNLVTESKSYVTATVSGLPSGLKFDKKTLAITGAARRPGEYVVKLSLKNASGYTLEQSFRFTVAEDGAVTALSADDQVRTGEPLVLYCDPAMGSVRKSGVHKLGRDGTKRVAVRATAAKGFVFAGWYEDPGFTTPATFWTGSGVNAKPKDYRNESQSVVMTGPTCLFARFVEKAAEGDPIAHLSFLGAGYCGASPIADEETWYQGVALPTNGCAVAFGSLSLPTVMVSGLPAGVKFDKAALRFTGVPTACSTDRKPFFTVKVTVKNKAGATDVLVKKVRVEPLPMWAVGNFDGYHIEDGVTNGTFTAAVGKTGKVSGKTNGGWADTTFGAKSFANVFTFDGENLIYTVDVTVKYKVYSEKFEQTDTLYLMEDPETHLGTIGGGDVYGNGAVGIQRAWDRKDLDFPAFDTKAPENHLVLENGLTLKFGAKGKVTVGGTLYGVRASGATYALPVAWRSTMTVNLLAQVPVYVAPTRNTPEFCRVYEVLLSVGEDGKLVCVPINPPPPVQLWADGPFFAQCNLGATKPTDYGELYDFDDAGTEVAKLGDGWRLPTKAELETLLDKSKCNRKWIVRDGVNGYLFTNKSDPVKSIFLPAASCDFGIGRDYDYVGREGDYWSSDECDDDSAWSLDFFEEIISVDSVLRCNGMSVRAVR